MYQDLIFMLQYYNVTFTPKKKYTKKIYRKSGSFTIIRNKFSKLDEGFFIWSKIIRINIVYQNNLYGNRNTLFGYLLHYYYYLSHYQWLYYIFCLTTL